MIAAAHSALYLSIPFCRTKCSFCNFASGVFSRELFDRYISRLEADLASAPALARECGSPFDPILDSIYLGGGTPSLLAPLQLDRLFAAVSAVFQPLPGAEITVEVAPGTLTSEVLAALLRARVNRVSLGVQSFVDQEAHSVGRLHSREIILSDIACLRQAGIVNLGADLIAGLPHQTAESWERSLSDAISLELPHLSVYMLEVDADSRLGRELIAGGNRYHAHHVPDEALTVSLYERAVARLNASGIAQYEISNFARPGFESRHNLRYWQRLPYFGFGVDAHSMLPAPTPAEPHRAVRLAAPDSLEAFLAPMSATVLGAPPSPQPLRLRWENEKPAKPPAAFEITLVSESEAVEETYFLGLRSNSGLELAAVRREFGPEAVERYRQAIADGVSGGLLTLEDGWLRLTSRGRLLSNEVFATFLRD